MIVVISNRVKYPPSMRARIRRAAHRLGWHRDGHTWVTPHAPFSEPRGYKAAELQLYAELGFHVELLPYSVDSDAR